MEIKIQLRIIYLIFEEKNVFLASKYSALRGIFNKTNQLVEKIGGIVFFIMIKLTPACVYVPWSIYTFVIYFATDVGNAAFELPYPIW